ncbi:TPA: host cell division inhibitor Icd-like protein [Yersinia enterocolitica]|uniref:host cell division inhibitor Icd-like protein n=1 Tax=Yersinia enterocolitica TaxID=630 RepID=UPI0028767D61|nr:host cell division inhibitor Icd-like protein [Yersinia enterocolitica]ELW8173914.1 host cell division inhibitor Icd-like protein [Yersinia enterocolitica]HDL6704868.1 host cell division inhibitor Icd-like protein [Yersinia enterocolitica]HDL6897210.1 host cell division inhibitor Icd-like protein [Yersinia enterocolitica]HDL8228851.1 host cell division inhibitor Icd-like protein [Yersinia enterocolitica]
MINVTCHSNSVLVPRQRNQSLALNNFSDDINKVEADSILTVFIFATIKRSDVKAKPVMMRVTARSYKEARQQLIRDYVISFAGRIPALEKMA